MNDTIESLRNQRNLLGDALGRLLVAIGMTRADAPLTGPELLLAAETAIAGSKRGTEAKALVHDHAELRCDTADEGAAFGLLTLMIGISEEMWCAGWMSGLEYALWRVQPGTRYGHGIISDRQSTLLRLLSDECDAWWMWVENDGPVLIRVEQWLKMVDLPRPTVND